MWDSFFFPGYVQGETLIVSRHKERSSSCQSIVEDMALWKVLCFLGLDEES